MRQWSSTNQTLKNIFKNAPQIGSAIASIFIWFALLVPPSAYAAMANASDFLSNPLLTGFLSLPLLVVVYAIYNFLHMVTQIADWRYLTLDLILVICVFLFVSVSLRNFSEMNASSTIFATFPNISASLESDISNYRTRLMAVEAILQTNVQAWYRNTCVTLSTVVSTQSKLEQEKGMTALREKARLAIETSPKATVSGTTTDQIVAGAQIYLCLVDGLTNIGSMSDLDIASQFEAVDATIKGNATSVFGVLQGVSTSTLNAPLLSRLICYEPTHLAYLRNIPALKIALDALSESRPDVGYQSQMKSVIFSAIFFVAVFIYLIFIMSFDAGLYYMSLFTMLLVVIAAMIYFALHVLVLVPTME